MCTRDVALGLAIMRRSAALSVSLVLLAASVSTAKAPAPAPWPQFRCNAAHTGEVAGVKPQEHAYVLWKANTLNEVHSSPVVAPPNVFVGSFTGVLHAFNMNTGKVAWERGRGSRRGR